MQKSHFAMQKPVRLFAAEDLLQVAALPVLTLVAWSTPERLWGPFSHILGFFAAASLRLVRIQSHIESIKFVLGERQISMTPGFLKISILADMVEHRLRILREYRPGGWRPRIELVGRQHIEKALSRGHGAILWVCPFYNSLPTKMALYQSGFAVSHLSTFAHGFSYTRFGLRVLNPIPIAIENRYVAERIVIPPEGSLGYIRKVEKRLRDNGLVSIRIGGVQGYRILELPFLQGRIRLTTGPPSLALASKATLLPVFTVRKGPGAFDVVVEPPLEFAEKPNRHESIECVLRQYVTILESYLVRYPALWPGWHNLKIDSPPHRVDN